VVLFSVDPNETGLKKSDGIICQNHMSFINHQGVEFCLNIHLSFDILLSINRQLNP